MRLSLKDSIVSWFIEVDREDSDTTHIQFIIYKVSSGKLALKVKYKLPGGHFYPRDVSYFKTKVGLKKRVLKLLDGEKISWKWIHIIDSLFTDLDNMER
jgi:hypothetical protein